MRGEQSKLQYRLQYDVYDAEFIPSREYDYNEEDRDYIIGAGIVDRPKLLGDLRGMSYIYPIFFRFGLIEVPEKVKEILRGKKK